MLAHPPPQFGNRHCLQVLYLLLMVPSGLCLSVSVSLEDIYMLLSVFPKVEDRCFERLGKQKQGAPWGILVYPMRAGGISAHSVRGRAEDVGGPGSNSTYLQEGRLACYHCRYTEYLKGAREGRAGGLLTVAPPFFL